MDTFGNIKTTKLAIFDLDGTLIVSPTPDKGSKEIYKERTGNDWPHIGWFSKPESLDMDVFDIPTIPEVVADYKIEARNPNTVTVMMTGRLRKLTNEVKTILFAHSLIFDEYCFNYGGTTEEGKIKAMDELLVKYPDVIEITFHDDRVPHMETFKNWGKKQCDSGRIKSFKYVLVPGWVD
jgi:hypothetical protein